VTLFNPEIISAAGFSPCGKYRYWLTRTWDTERSQLAWIMLNPSTADASANDPTIRKCMGFARDWGYGGIIVVNLFAYRTAYPSELRTVADPVGPDNDREILRWVDDAAEVVAAWGSNQYIGERDREVLRLLKDRAPKCLGTTNEGCPRHPLYVKGDVTPLHYPAKIARRANPFRVMKEFIRDKGCGETDGQP